MEATKPPLMGTPLLIAADRLMRLLGNAFINKETDLISIDHVSPGDNQRHHNDDEASIATVNRHQRESL